MSKKQPVKTMKTSRSNAVDWEKLAKNLQIALAKEINESDELENKAKQFEALIAQQEVIIRYLESQVWKLLNLKG